MSGTSWRRFEANGVYPLKETTTVVWWLAVSYCWWFRNPVNSPVEVGRLSHYLQGFVHHRWLFRISKLSAVVPLGSLANDFSWCWFAQEQLRLRTMQGWRRLLHWFPRPSVEWSPWCNLEMQGDAIDPKQRWQKTWTAPNTGHGITWMYFYIIQKVNRKRHLLTCGSSIRNIPIGTMFVLRGSWE